MKKLAYLKFGFNIILVALSFAQAKKTNVLIPTQEEIATLSRLKEHYGKVRAEGFTIDAQIYALQQSKQLKAIELEAAKDSVNAKINDIKIAHPEWGDPKEVNYEDSPTMDGGVFTKKGEDNAKKENVKKGNEASKR